MENYIETRPWGLFEILLEESYCKVKRITIKPGHQTSYQYHVKRNEVWTVVQGKLEITLNGKKQVGTSGFAISIPALMKHGAKNIGNDDLVFIEVQHGDSFEEEDIIRLKDDYGRA